MALRLALSALLVLAPFGASAAEATLDGTPAVVVAHRGASGYRPDHTLEAYRLAVEQGADFIEPDLVATKDGSLVARHEPMLSETTDVAERPEFADRKTTRLVDGVPTTDWFASDFTLAEIRTLFARQPIASRDRSFDGKLRIPTLQEVVDLAKAESARTGRTIGIAPETKHPTFHYALGLPLEEPLLDILDQAGWTSKEDPVVIQSFEVGNLKYLKKRTGVRLAQLVAAQGVDAQGQIVLGAAPGGRPYDFAVSGDERRWTDLLTAEGLKEIATYADIVAPWKPYLIPAVPNDDDGDGKPDDVNGDGRVDWRDRTMGRPSALVGNAHAAGLRVYAWTFRADPQYLAADFGGDGAMEIRAFLDLGVDGVFSDFPDVAVKARDAGR